MMSGGLPSRGVEAEEASSFSVQEEVALNYELSRSQSLQAAIEKETRDLAVLLDHAETYQTEAWNQISFSDYLKGTEEAERTSRIEPVVRATPDTPAPICSSANLLTPLGTMLEYHSFTKMTTLLETLRSIADKAEAPRSCS